MVATPISYPAVPKGEDLYNALMAKIEPDLLTSALAGLEAKYKNETKDEAAARAKRYQEAFAEYEKQLAQYMGALQGQVHQYRKSAIDSAESEERTKESAKLNSLEQAISGI